MNEILINIGKGIIGIIIAVFLPKQIFISIREFIVFGLKSILKYWKYNFLFILLSFFIYFKTTLLNEIDISHLIFALAVLILIFSIIFSFVSIYLKLNKQNSLMIYGCYSSKEKEYLFLDLDAELINDKLIRECENLNNNLFILKSKTLSLDFLEFPKFIPIILGYRGTTRFFEKFISNNKHISSLYFIRDVTDQRILTNLNYNQNNFVNAELITLLTSLQDKISYEKIDIKVIAVINLKLYVLVFGQSFLDYFVNSNDYKNSNRILEDTEKILLEVKGQIEQNITNELKEFKDFFNIWSSYIDRYKAILLIEQDELKGAISYIINSIQLNPYYPYSNYHTFKTNFSKRYGIELSYSIEGTSKEFEVDEINDFEKIREQLSESIVSKEAEFNTKIVQEIIRRDDKQLFLKYLEIELKVLDNSNPAILLLKSDILKYLPDGTEKINEIYYGRIDETISLLNEIIKIDNKFPIINAKIGSLMMSKAIHNGNEKDIENGIKIWTEGMHFLTELGFKSK